MEGTYLSALTFVVRRIVIVVGYSEADLAIACTGAGRKRLAQCERADISGAFIFPVASPARRTLGIERRRGPSAEACTQRYGCRERRNFTLTFQRLMDGQKITWQLSAAFVASCAEDAFLVVRVAAAEKASDVQIRGGAADRRLLRIDHHSAPSRMSRRGGV